MSSCQVRRQRAVGSNWDGEGQGGVGEQRPDGLEEWKALERADQGSEDADEGGERWEWGVRMVLKDCIEEQQEAELAGEWAVAMSQICITSSACDGE